MAIPFAAIGGLANLLFGLGAQRRQQALQEQALKEQKRSTRFQEDLATADQVDAYGNTTSYTPGLGFRTEVIPIIKAILNAQNKEQLATLTEDAPRAREAAGRQDARSKQASGVYDRVFKEIQSNYRKPESEVQAEDTLSMLSDRNASPFSAALLNQALRSGNPAAIKDVSQGANAQIGSLAGAIARAKQGGSARYAGEKKARDSANYGELDVLRGIADNAPGARPDMSNDVASYDAKQSNSLNRLIQVIANGGTGAASILSDMAGSVQPIDISGALAGIEKDFGQQKPSPEQQQLEELLAQLDLKKARIGNIEADKTLAEYMRGNQGGW